MVRDLEKGEANEGLAVRIEACCVRTTQDTVRVLEDQQIHEDASYWTWVKKNRSHTEGCTRPIC